MKKIILPIIGFIGLILFCVLYQDGFCAAMIILGQIINIFGTAIIFVLNQILSIPEIAQEIAKRLLTTLLVWIVYGTSLYKTEKKLVWGIMGGIASIICSVIAWF